MVNRAWIDSWSPPSGQSPQKEPYHGAMQHPRPILRWPQSTEPGVFPGLLHRFNHHREHVMTATMRHPRSISCCAWFNSWISPSIQSPLTAPHHKQNETQATRVNRAWIDSWISPSGQPPKPPPSACHVRHIGASAAHPAHVQVNRPRNVLSISPLGQPPQRGPHDWHNGTSVTCPAHDQVNRSQNISWIPPLGRSPQ